jgi:hypothetical protein
VARFADIMDSGEWDEDESSCGGELLVSRTGC